MKIKSTLTALRVAATSRRPYVTKSYWRNRKLMPDTLGAEPLGIYRSRDCQLQRASMASRRSTAVKNRLIPVVDRDITGAELPLVTLCLVTYNSSNWIEGWFKSVSQSGYPKDKLALSIVDNASTDQTSKKVKECLKTYNFANAVQYHENPSNLGFGLGQDKAISMARSEFILVINPDAYLRPDGLKRAVKFALNDELDICAWEFSQLPFEHPKYYDPVTLETSWNSHACVLLKKSAYLKADGYDQSLFMYGEDVDLSYRLRLAGFRLRYLPWARVDHDSFLEQGGRSEQSVRIIAANLCLRRRYGRAYDKLIGYLMFFRAQFSSNPEVKISTKKAWVLYKGIRSNFKPIRRGKIYFPFNGLEFDRIRLSKSIEVGCNNEADAGPKISVITRVHKKTDILGEALLSVSNQTYRNIEHVVVFDKCEPYFIADQTVVRGKFRTRSEAANAGANAATGQYLLFLDYDDLLFADHVERLVLTVQSHPDAIGAYGLSWEAMTAERASGGDKYLGFQIGMELAFKPEKMETQNFFAIQSILIDKYAFMNVGGFEDSMDKLEDWDLWKRLKKLGQFTGHQQVTSIYYTPDDIRTRFKRASELIP